MTHNWNRKEILSSCMFQLWCPIGICSAVRSCAYTAICFVESVQELRFSLVPRVVRRKEFQYISKVTSESFTR